MRAGKSKLFIVAVIVVLALGYLVYAGVRESMVYYLTLDEMFERVPEIHSSKIRVSGKVVPGSIVKDIDGSLEFSIADEEHNLDVMYKGIIPDIFADDVEAIVEGTYTEAGVFQADLLLAKCPTKYESTDGLEYGTSEYNERRTYIKSAEHGEDEGGDG